MNKHSVGKNLKDKHIRNSEYYGMTETFDNLYQRAKNKENFRQLMKIIVSEKNILLAYRNIKGNKGSRTPSVDKITIKTVEKMSQESFVKSVKMRFRNYTPGKVRRKEIPKLNGKTRPLGIPSFWDRLIQQCILQVLEPICEAHFCPRSYGFRPNRSAEQAIADSVRKINRQDLTFVVDVDIKGFFDEVNHVKLMRQLWTLGIRDKQLLVIIRKVLKAPIIMTDGSTIYPTKGTPQGGILSPLLANINLNEFDWWISRQWETFVVKEVTPKLTKQGAQNRSHENVELKKTRLKPMYIVRYADDFKIFTNTRSNAEKIYKACKGWLKERLKLPISEEKSKVTNLKRERSEFLGFTLKATKKGKRLSTGKTKYVAETHVSPKAIKIQVAKLTDQIKKLQKSASHQEIIRNIGKYNSMVIGAHNYYCIATHVSRDFHWPGRNLTRKMYNRLPRGSKADTFGFSRVGKYVGKDKGIIPYLGSKTIRFYMKRPILPFAYVLHKNPMSKRIAINKYTSEGRKLIHKGLENVTEAELRWLREHPVINDRATIEFNDNRISLFVAQNGRCGVMNEKLELTDMHCHHKRLWSETQDDNYANLILVKSEIHKLIHLTNEPLAKKLVDKLKVTDKQIEKLNKLRFLVGNNSICTNKTYYEQLTLF